MGNIFKTKFIFLFTLELKNFSKIEIKKFQFIEFIEPLEFLDFLFLMKNSKIVLTDSGGIQEETP